MLLRLRRCPVAVCASPFRPRRWFGRTAVLAQEEDTSSSKTTYTFNWEDLHSSRGFGTHELPSFVKIVEVGPRDGLQNEPEIVPTERKIEFINKLSDTGLSVVEATSFVSKKWVPQMGDAKDVMQNITRKKGVNYPVLTPNKKGLDAALEVGATEVAIFGAASDSFSKKNINCNVVDSLERFRPVCEEATAAGLKVRGYVSCVLGCPYEGDIHPDAVGFVAASLREMGCYEISLGDTIGVGTPIKTKALIDSIRNHVPMENIAVHFHNTYAQALANILVAIQEGVATVDSSVAGLGGCPYAKGASGNVPTEDVIYMLHGMGIETGTNLEQLVDAGQWMCDLLGKRNGSNVANAILAKRG